MADTILSAELETLAVRELLLEWAHINRTYFRGALVAPQIVLSLSSTYLGRFHPTTRSLELSRSLVLGKPWGTVIEVVKHETAHQYVHEVLGVRDEPAHGPTFRKVCDERGIDAAAVGLPDSVDPSSAHDARVLQRVARLLALAESPNRHEAEAAAAQAQRLMLKHNLSRPHDAEQRRYAFRHVGRITARLGAADRLLGMILGKHFFVSVIWVSVYRPLEAKHGRVLELCGTPENLEIAAYAHQFLEQTAARLWVDHKREQQLQSDRDRRTFLAGVMAGFAEKLRGQEREHRAEGLVWVKDAKLDAYLSARHPRTRSLRAAQATNNAAFRHGHLAGREIVLRRGVTAGAQQRGLRLGPGAR